MDNICCVMPIPATADNGHDPTHLSFQEREDFLLMWTLKNCADDSVLGIEEGWNLLNSYGLRVLHKFLSAETSASETDKPIGTKGFASLYTISYKLCTTNSPSMVDHARDLYNRCKLSVEDFVEANIVQKLSEMLSGEGIDFLQEYADGWSRHKKLTNWVWPLRKNLDKTVVRTEQLPTVTACYLNCFYNQVFQRFNVHTRACLLQCFAEDRCGKFLTANRDILKDVIEVYVMMGLVYSSTPSSPIISLREAFMMPPDLTIYKSEIEDHVIDAATDFYKDQSHVLSSVQTVLEFRTYMKGVTDAVLLEETISVAYFHPSTKLKLVKACLTSSIVNVRGDIIKNIKRVFDNLKKDKLPVCLTLTEAQTDQMRTMYCLFQLTHLQHPENVQFNFLDKLSSEFYEYIVLIGDRIINTRIQHQAALGKEQLEKTSASSSSSSSSSSSISSSSSSSASGSDISKLFSVSKTPSLYLKNAQDFGPTIPVPLYSLGNFKKLDEELMGGSRTDKDSLTNGIGQDEISKSKDRKVFLNSNTAGSSDMGNTINIDDLTKGISDSGSVVSSSAMTESSSSASLLFPWVSSSSTSSTFNSIVSPIATTHKTIIDVETEFVEFSLRMLQHVSEMVKKLFINDLSFQKVVIDGVSTFVNKDATVMCVDKIPPEDTNNVQKRIKKQKRRLNKRQKESVGDFTLNFGNISPNKDLRGSENEVECESDSDSDSDKPIDNALGNKKSKTETTEEIISAPITPALDPASSSSLQKSGASSFTSSSCVLSTQVSMLAAYCDRLLKGGIRRDDNEVGVILDQCVILFGHMSDKDLFAQLYRDALSKRLLSKKSKSNDLERAVISNMRAKCGGVYTSKLEGMLNDFQLAENMNKDFDPVYTLWRGQQHNPALSVVSFGVQVLSSGHWPSQRHTEALLPPELEICKTFFGTWYQSIHTHRALKWVLTLGEAVVSAHYKDRSYDIQLSTLQAIVLRVFDRSKVPISFSALLELTGISDSEILKRLLHSLSCQKFKILLKTPQTRSVSSTDIFKVNSNFSYALKKFRVPMALLEDVVPVKDIEVERGATIDAAIVRIMKSRKVLSHIHLVSEILQHLNFFVPDPRQIKQRIEMLIEKEYLRRDITDNKSYHYVP